MQQVCLDPSMLLQARGFMRIGPWLLIWSRSYGCGMPLVSNDSAENMDSTQGQNAPPTSLPYSGQSAPTIEKDFPDSSNADR